MKDKSSLISLCSILMFIIGVVSCSNILSAFIVGSTPIMIANVLSIPLLLLCLIQHNGKLIYIAQYMTKDLLYTGFFIFCSIISVILFNPGNIYQWLVGCINILLQFFLIMSIIECKDSINFLCWGILIGILINFIISVYAMFLYNSGVILDLGQYFPHETGMGKMYLSNAFRVQGLFKEQGHLMRYLAIIAIPIVQFAKHRSKPLYVISVVAIVFMMAFTGSSSIAVFIVGYAAYNILVNGKSGAKILLKILGIIILLISLLYLGRSISFISRLLTAFQVGFTSVFDTTGVNSSRVQGMKYAIDIIKDYPIIGCGWNGFTKVLMNYGVYGVNYIMGSYSGALSLIAEIGLASVFYFFFLIDKGINLIKYKADTSCVGFGVSLLIYFVLFCVTDYVLDAGSAVFLALALLKYKETQIALVGSQSSFA